MAMAGDRELRCGRRRTPGLAVAALRHTAGISALGDGQCRLGKG